MAAPGVIRGKTCVELASGQWYDSLMRSGVRGLAIVGNFALLCLGCGGETQGAGAPVPPAGGSSAAAIRSGGVGGTAIGSGGAAYAAGGNAGPTGGVSFGGNSTGGLGTGGAAAGGAATSTGGHACLSGQYPAASPIVMLIAVDASGSMNDVAASTNGQSKWAVLGQAWAEVLPSFRDSWAVGLMSWSCPDCPNGPYQPSIAVPIAPLDAAQRVLLTNALPAAAAGGNRPTECAYDFALQQVESWQGPSAYAESPRYVVLLTDGAPAVESDCRTTVESLSREDYDAFIGKVADATASTGIKTLVGGLPGSELLHGTSYDPLYQLSLLAAAGGTLLPNCTVLAGVPGSSGTVDPRGTYCHYDMTAQPDLASSLRATLNGMVDAMARCRYPFPYPPPGYAFVSTLFADVALTVDGVETRLTEAPEDDCTQGGQWFYSTISPVSGQPVYLELCPDLCARVSRDPTATIWTGFQCPR
jgi:hypothetical protein